MELNGLFPLYETVLDSPEDRYLSYKKTAERYRIIQVGIVPFHKVNEKEYIARPYKIYVFPNNEFHNNRFDGEIGAIVFNRDHGMDFNKVIYGGVPYVNNFNLKRMTEHYMNDSLNFYEKENRHSFKSIVLYKSWDKQNYSEFLEKFNTFFNNPEEKTFFHVKLPKYLLIHFLNNIPNETRSQIYFSYDTQNNLIKIEKVTKEERILRIQQEKNEMAKKVVKGKGVKNIFDKIIEKKLTVVGHNCLCDFLFLISHFGDELPSTYELFKKKMQKDFKKVFDTKYCFYELNKDNPEESEKSYHLEGLYKKYLEEVGYKIKVTIPTEEKFINYLDPSIKGDAFHQADFDAFVTGYLFLLLGEKFGSDKIEECTHKFNLATSAYKCMNLIGDDEYRKNAVRNIS